MARRRYKRYKKSRAKGYYGRSLYRRSRRYRARYWARRRYRRRSGLKVEYKRIESTLTCNFTTDVISYSGNPNSPQFMQKIAPYPYAFTTIGGNSVLNDIPNVTVSQGTGYAQRVGNKINPVKLRCFGSINLIPRDDIVNDNIVPEYQDLKLTQPIYLRVLIIQTRAANTAYNHVDKPFSSINPYIKKAADFRSQISNSKPITITYNGTQGTQFYPDIDWYPEIFEAPSNYYTASSITETDVANVVTVYQGYKTNTINAYTANILLKTPYRYGIGSCMKVLKNKVYKVHPVSTQSVAFRFKTKKPLRMVWPEQSGNEDMSSASCKNTIYICLIPVFPYPNYPARMNINFGYDMFYTDI